ncbi:Acyl carrier protein [Alteromonas sp. 38]|uniref:DUF6005 family protein n=1 Tax=unclassified Alteromonas TaxID=2614992 RepID=UPI0012EFCD64|nr:MULTISPECIES: DUF6005 family protein [unclassified Alteromonas]CAD5261034.1 Acyl carrier protein [Alteromonas sp. 154]VXC29935.1 Acyl carrier protein [Alteromonas sp. 38]
MDKQNIIDAIKLVLEKELNNQKLRDFRPAARLNEDLYLDSVQIMQLLVHIELTLGIDIPDAALSNEDVATVSSLADFLLSQSNGRTNETSNATNEVTEVQEEFEDIKVHCFVSCLCESIKADPRVDHRPFYFGVWDAEVLISNDHHLAYHSDDINHDEFRAWYKKIYGVSVTPWYCETLSKQENLHTLQTLLAQKSESENIMVMLDMYLLPERENKFNQNPFPHYVMLEETREPEIWFMHDPDFRWEGTQNKSQVIAAIESKAVAGGYIFDSSKITPSKNSVIADYFLTCFNANHNPMTDKVRDVVHAHIDTKNSATDITQLGEALKQLPVLAIRKYAYEHGFAFFWRDIGFPEEEFEYWCDVIEALVSNYKNIHFRAMKLASEQPSPAHKKALIEEILLLLDQQDEREYSIKKHLFEVFSQWSSLHQINLHGTQKRVEEVAL